MNSLLLVYIYIYIRVKKKTTKSCDNERDLSGHKFSSFQEDPNHPNHPQMGVVYGRWMGAFPTS